MKITTHVISSRLFNRKTCCLHLAKDQRTGCVTELNSTETKIPAQAEVQAPCQSADYVVSAVVTYQKTTGIQISHNSVNIDHFNLHTQKVSITSAACETFTSWAPDSLIRTLWKFPNAFKIRKARHSHGVLVLEVDVLGHRRFVNSRSDIVSALAVLLGLFSFHAVAITFDPKLLRRSWRRKYMSVFHSVFGGLTFVLRRLIFGLRSLIRLILGPFNFECYYVMIQFLWQKRKIDSDV